MIQPDEPRKTLETALERVDTDGKDTTLLRLAAGMFTLTLAVFGAYTTHYVVRAAKQAYTLAKTLAVLVVVFGIYYGLSSIVTGAISAATNRIVAQLTQRGNLDERIANAIGVVVALTAIYAVYCVMKWSVAPVTKFLSVPDSEQTSVMEYITEQTTSTADPNPPEGSMAHDILNGD